MVYKVEVGVVAVVPVVANTPITVMAHHPRLVVGGNYDGWGFDPSRMPFGKGIKFCLFLLYFRTFECVVLTS